MKNSFTFLSLLLMTTLLFSCEKNAPEQAQNPAELKQNDAVLGLTAGAASSNCLATTVTLIAGQHINAGTVSVTNDADFIYVTYETANGYTLKQTHLYVGNCAGIPVTNSGNPVPGQFPYASAHANITSYTYQVPISAININSCGCIAAHAVVQKRDANGHVIDQQTAWGNGTRINPRGNWGMKFEYCSCSGGQP